MGVIILLETIKLAKIGTIVPIFKEVYEEVNAFEYFAKLSNYGKKKNSIFIEDKVISYGTVNPCLVISGKDFNFEIKALNETGKRILAFIKNNFGFCDKASYTRDRIQGILKPSRRAVTEDQKIKLKTHIDVIRVVASAFEQGANELSKNGGLVGIFSFDFINNLEDIQKNKEDTLKDPDYMIYFVDNFFLVDHSEKKSYFVANVLVTDNKKEQAYEQCNKAIKNYEKVLESKLPKPGKFKKKEFKSSFDTSKDEFLRIIKELKRNIVENNILHAVPSRLTACNYNCEALDLFQNMKKISNSLCYYINDEFGLSIGYDSGSSFIVHEANREVRLQIVSATKPRGKAKGNVDNDLDNKYETLLRVNQNKIIKHTMLLDAARNEVAKICKPGTRNVERLFFVEKHEQNQHLISEVKGVINDELDALHAYLATINFDLSGLPKIKAIELLRKTEKTSRGFYSGSVIQLGINGNFSCSVIENFRVKKDMVYFRTNSFVLHNTNEEMEIKENESKIANILELVKSSGGLK